ncbi:MAG: hypothetical protein NTZ27_02225 [Ignavibacteriales bacterium]|nr:hypothetical protein [Ignavibacteriales bacterium]
METKILKWLEKQGYPLEMYVSQKFRERKFTVSQSIYYYDYEFNINREIDVLAHKGICIEDRFASIDYIIECKSSKKPWLLFSTKKEISYDPIIEAERYIHNENATSLIVHLSSTDLIKKLYPFYYDFGTTGYGLTQAFTSGNDIAYKAINTLSKYCNSAIRSSNGKMYPDSKIIIPILVIDTPLFEVTLSENYEQKIERKNIGCLSFNHVTIIVVIREYLDEFCILINDSSEWLLEYCKANLQTIQLEHEKSIKSLYNNMDK